MLVYDIRVGNTSQHHKSMHCDGSPMMDTIVIYEYEN